MTTCLTHVVPRPRLAASLFEGGSNMQIRNSKLCEASKCRLYSAVNHSCFSTDGVCCGLSRLHVTFGGSNGIMTTAGQEF